MINRFVCALGVAATFAGASFVAWAQESSLEMKSFNLKPSPGGIFANGIFTIKNTSNRDIKDVMFECTWTGESGTLIKKVVSERQFVVIAAGKQRTLSDVNMSTPPSQKNVQYSCRVMSAEWK